MDNRRHCQDLEAIYGASHQLIDRSYRCLVAGRVLGSLHPRRQTLPSRIRLHFSKSGESPPCRLRRCLAMERPPAASRERGLPVPVGVRKAHEPAGTGSPRSQGERTSKTKKHGRFPGRASCFGRRLRRLYFCLLPFAFKIRLPPFPNQALASSRSLANASASLTAISAMALRSSRIFAFFRPAMNLL